METFGRRLMHWRWFGDLALLYSPSKIYEAVPANERDSSPIGRTRVLSTGRADVQIHASSAVRIPLINLALPTAIISTERGEGQPRSSVLLAAGMLSIAVLLNILKFLRPSFLHFSHGVNNKPYKIQSTTYLNGVRGIAAICVCFQHYLVKYNKFLDNGYLSGPEDSRLLQLPFIRLIFTGRFMVANFFILSGFVLSHKPLRLIRTKDASLLDCLASSVFRRVPRLFLPLVAIMIATAFCTYGNWYRDQPPDLPIDPNAQYPSLLSRLNEEFKYFTDLVNPFSWGTSHPLHTPHLWTLPMEFRGSMVVFLSLLCLSKAKAAFRMLLLTGFAWYCLQIGHWDTFLFVSGTLIAEYHLIQKDAGYCFGDLLQSINLSNKATMRYLRAVYPIFWSLVFLLGLYIGSWPCNNASTTPGLITFDSLTPHRYNTEEDRGYFWYSIAAVLVMMAFENFPILQRPFTTPLARYLGDISFAFYIIHWTVLWTVGRVITNKSIALFGEYLGFAVGGVIVFPLLICIADVYWRLFDDGSVAFSKWLWIKCSTSELHVITSNA